MTPVKLNIKVRKTEVTDLKEFLARKKLERDFWQANKHRVSATSATPESSQYVSNNDRKTGVTITKPNAGNNSDAARDQQQNSSKSSSDWIVKGKM